MKIKFPLRKVGRKPLFHWSFYLFFGLLAILVIVIVFFAITRHPPIKLCLFSKWTQLPCPTCGSTRAFFSLLRGEFILAFLYNPLVVSLFFILILSILFKTVTGYFFQLKTDRGGAFLLFWLGILIILGNWLYLYLTLAI